MALSDILQAITADTDRQLAEKEAALQQKLMQEKDKLNLDIVDVQRAIDQQCDKKIQQLKQRTEAHGSMNARAKILAWKREEFDHLYADVLDALTTLSDDHVQPILERCLMRLPKGGTITPSAQHASLIASLCKKMKLDAAVESSTNARGGFVWSDGRTEIDNTFETLVMHIYRPHSEIEVSSLLFTQ